MAAPIFIQLTPDEDAQLQQLLNDPNTHPKVRRRALAVRLSAQHWSAPRIAQFLGCHHTTVRNDLKRWQQYRYDGLADGKASGAPPKLTSEVKAYLIIPTAWAEFTIAPLLQVTPASRGEPRTGSVPPASRGNLKEGGFNPACFCKLCPRDWYSLARLKTASRPPRNSNRHLSLGSLPTSRSGLSTISILVNAAKPSVLLPSWIRQAIW